MKSVLWSDEYKFEIFSSIRHVFVKRREGEQMVSAYVVPPMTYGGGHVMVWGGFAGDTVGNLCAQHVLELLQDSWKSITGDDLMKQR